MRMCVLVLAVALTGCNATKEAGKTLDSCIQPPVTGVMGQDKIAADIAAKLAKLDVEAKAKAEFASLLKADFSTLSDRNVSLLLFLRAIECYLKLGVVGEEIAKGFAQTVREEWSAQVGFRGVDGPLTPLEKEFIKRSAHSGEILTAFDHLGVR